MTARPAPTWRSLDCWTPTATWDDDTAAAYRAAAVLAAWAAVNGEAGARCGDATHERVTEGRKRTAGVFYSTCGELPHFVLDCLGVSAPWCQRGQRYRIGWNLSALMQFPRVPVERLRGGDVLLFDGTRAHDEHVAVCLGAGRNGFALAEYGQHGAYLPGATDGHARLRRADGAKRLIGGWDLDSLLARARDAGALSGSVLLAEGPLTFGALADGWGEAGADFEAWAESAVALAPVVQQ